MIRIAAMVVSLVLAAGTASLAQQQGGPQNNGKCPGTCQKKSCPKDCKGPGQGGKQCPRAGQNCPRK